MTLAMKEESSQPDAVSHPGSETEGSSRWIG